MIHRKVIRLSTVRQAATAAQWRVTDNAAELWAFLDVLEHNALMARSDDPELVVLALEATSKICVFLGDLVDDPAWRRQEEEHRRSSAAGLAEAETALLGSLEDLETDTALVVDFARQALVEAEVWDVVKTGMCYVQILPSPLFLPEKWSRWFGWACEHFFVRPADDRSDPGATPPC